jgi:hypothetical protein
VGTCLLGTWRVAPRHPVRGRGECDRLLVRCFDPAEALRAAVERSAVDGDVWMASRDVAEQNWH